MRSEVETVPGTDGEPGLPDPAADRLVVAEVSRLEPRNARGDAGLCRNGEGAQPLAIRPAAVGGDVLTNGSGHRAANVS